MKTILTALAAFLVLPTVVSAQNTATTNSAKPSYYDTFNNQWMDPAKWNQKGPGCDFGPTLECVREIQQGRLRLLTRTMGARNSDYDAQFGASQLEFSNPPAIFSVTADVQLGRVNVVACPTNISGQPTLVMAKIAGGFFNTGTGLPEDDVTDDVIFWVDATNPKYVQVFNWMTGAGLGVNTPIGTYPISTPLTVTNTWDKSNKRFISVVQTTGDSDSAKRVIVPYTVGDSTTPVFPNRQFIVYSFPLNCTSTQTFAELETFFDNVMINKMPRADQ